MRLRQLGQTASGSPRTNADDERTRQVGPLRSTAEAAEQGQCIGRGGGPSLGIFRKQVGWLWWRSLKRRSQSHHVPWRRMEKSLRRWLPPARICHPQPLARLSVITQGKSRMR